MPTGTSRNKDPDRCHAFKCRNLLPPKARKYCSRACAKREEMRRYRAKRGSDPKVQAERRAARTAKRASYESHTGDDDLDRIADYAPLIEAGQWTQTQVAAAMGIDQAQVSRLMQRWRIAQDDEAAGEHWTPPEPYAEDPVEDFVAFRADCFQTSDGAAYHTPEFQKRWLRNIIDAMDAGACLEILSPPRHGKTELLTHLCVWLIIRRPNIRIVYVGGSAEIAEQSVEMAKDHLELNERLARFLPPGQRYKPPSKSGRTWTKTRFTVGTRTITGIKSPTMVAVGRGGKMPSRDADLIVVDDPEDHDATINPGTREDTRGWMAKSVLSRKEANTCLFVIGSRVHPDDLVGHLAQSPQFDVIIEQAHDPLCDKDPNDHSAHVSCMLWPSMRDHGWLMGKKDDPLEGMFFQMVYQNEALDDEMAHFRPEDIDACKDPKRVLGHIPKGTRLIAGLDPSVSGYQAAFLWAVDLDSGKRYMVDVDNRSGGGIQPALEVIQRWYHAYNLHIWVIEENLYHGAIEADDTIRQWAREHYVMIEGHETYGNKWDKDFGVTSLARYFKTELEDGSRQVSLPTGDEASKQATTLYRRQLINFNRDALGMTKKRNPSGDVLMASWFPETTIRSWAAEKADEGQPDPFITDYPFEPMALVAADWL